MNNNYNNNYNKSHNNNNNNRNNNNNDILYNSVFNNLYLKRIIFNHLSKFNLFYNNIEFKSLEEWNQFKYKEYLNEVTFIFDYYEHLNQLPQNIKHINISTPIDTNKPSPQIPDHIESICISLLDINTTFYKSITSTPSNLSKIKIKSLVLNNNQYKLIKDTFPSNLNNLILFNFNDNLIESGCLSSSISKVGLYNSTPLIINQFPLNSLIRLDLFSFNFKVTFDSSIRFPNSLQHLKLSCVTFNTSLPDGLKSLDLTIDRYDHKIVFPQSLESLFILFSIASINCKDIFQDKSSLPNNLKSLEFSTSTIVDNNGQSILPDKLESLVIIARLRLKFIQVLKTNQLPPTLTHLNLGRDFNQHIDINVLPSNLKTLVLGHDYSQIINPLSIPQQLELLTIDNTNYDNPINLLPTHPNTEIKCSNLNLYYNVSNISIRKLCLPNSFNSPLSRLQLQDKSSLEYLNLGYSFDQPIKLSDLPINNNIKTLVLGYKFKQIINLQLFQNLETLILSHNTFVPKIITTETTTNQQQDIIYNNYKLKNIKVPLDNRSNVLKSLDTNFHHFKFIINK